MTSELEALKAIEDAETQSFSFDTDSIVRKDNKVAKTPKPKKEDDSFGERQSLSLVWVAVIVLCTTAATAAMCCLKGKSAKVGEAPSDFSDRKDVKRDEGAPGTAWAAEQTRPAALVDGNSKRRVEM